MIEQLQTLIAAKRKASIRPEFQDKVTDAEVLGTLVSEYLTWAGDRILVTAAAALADANFHEAAQKVKGMSLREPDPEMQAAGERLMTALGFPTADETNEHVLREFEKLKDAGVIDYVLPSKPLGEVWVIGHNGQIVKLSTDQAVAYLLGAAGVTRKVATRMGVI